MNLRTTYEILISEKLQQIPVPDMADAIWARIETQLDIDMPGDNSGSNGDTNTPGTGGGIFSTSNLLLVFVAALITVYFVTRSNNKSSDNTLPTVTEQPIITPAKEAEESPPANNKTQSVKNPSPQNDLAGEPVLSIDPDTVLQFLPIISTPTENNQQDIVAKPPLQKPVTDTSKPEPKKGKGVTGITDNDYKIVPTKKDSTKN